MELIFSLLVPLVLEGRILLRRISMINSGGEKKKKNVELNDIF